MHPNNEKLSVEQLSSKISQSHYFENPIKTEKELETALSEPVKILTPIIFSKNKKVHFIFELNTGDFIHVSNPEIYFPKVEAFFQKNPNISQEIEYIHG